ncbi:inositol phospholipid synthesis and fat-storage-inducing TM-domain-containing protein [Schizothecium vesticola]|uniref:Acyl-coenzyme A diphosphatase SCS3 n=1 Tax=Schizothecium vesticola TaxID=314040 RepID=A0AA40BQY7_9PEZI|nr:inositol phospholipid synthesis and fat-storage-inducing TM-domain-containing protein [Schizothecium vesticola]
MVKTTHFLDTRHGGPSHPPPPQNPLRNCRHGLLLARRRSPTTPLPATTTPPARNTPYLPTPTELVLLATYPTLLLFGALFSAVSPQTRAAPYDAIGHAHVQTGGFAPSYFARKDNLFNTLFVKRGWAWITVAFFVFVFTHPALGSTGRRTRASVRWAVVTMWWVFVTQWFFGPAIIDRGFRWSGGKCDVAVARADAGVADTGEAFTSAACKSMGGKWSGGHDISGHVFLLVLGSFFLVQEVGWVAARWAQYVREERSVVMYDGAVKGAGVEMERAERYGGEDVTVTIAEALGNGGSLVAGVVGLSGWMLLMTAIYFHTWFEKFTGLMVALAGLYVTYILPRWVPALRQLIGLPGI